MPVSASIGIRESTDVAEARRVALALAVGLSFDETSAGNVGLVVTEAARNIVKHAGGGQVILRSLNNGSASIEMLALDRGPGIADVGRCFQDGYSTAGTAGNGLGAIARLSDIHEIYSQREQGTVLMAQISRSGHAGARRFAVGGVCLAVSGEDQCGDEWIFQERAGGGRFTLADGLGHGPLAADAARAAISTARERLKQSAPALMENIHGVLRPTRGAAVAVADIDSSAQLLRYVGLGNIAGTILPQTGPSRHLVSSPGTAGHQARKIVEFTYPWESGCLLLMHSDGLQTQWSLDPYPGLRQRHPSLIAGVLYRDYARKRDDVTVIVAREARAEA